MAISYGKDYAYADNRLRNTLISYKGYPLWVERINGHGYVMPRFIGTNQFNGLTPHIDECDVTPIPLGYVNKGNESVYLERIPSRLYRQGLTRDSLYSVGRDRVGLTSDELAKTLQNIYPSIETCIELITNFECMSWAFARKFSVVRYKANSKTIDLHYRGRKVGYFKGGLPFLEKKFSFLRESLEECSNVG